MPEAPASPAGVAQATTDDAASPRRWPGSGDRTVVIGGGAAGIAAARTLHDAGADVLLVEASDRLGGRARSLRLPEVGGTVDLGCGWLHSARRNPWTRIAEASGFTVDRSSPGWDTQWRDLDFVRHEQEAFEAARARVDAAMQNAQGGPDRPLSDVVPAGEPWRPLLDAMSGYVSGAPLAEVSLHDAAAYDSSASEDNWAVREGYGTLVAAHAGDVPVRLGTPVTRVDRRGRTLRLDTRAGAIEADRVVVAVPTSALAEGGLAFDPPLPDKRQAAADLPLGIANKAFLLADRPEWEANQHLIGDPRSALTGSHRLSPFGWPLIESFYGGEGAEALEAGDAAAIAIEELIALLGTAWRARLRPVAATGWRREPYIAGAYSHARVGCAHQRRALAEPVEERIFFAGEACSPTDFSTAHGAYETGVRAARAILDGAR